MRFKRLSVGVVAIAGAAWIATPGAGLASSQDTIPHYSTSSRS